MPNTYQYDTLNRATGLTNNWAGSLSFGYDVLSRRTQLSRPNNVNTTYSYDSLSHLLSVLHTGTNDGASYVYDSAGNRTSKQNLLTGTTSSYSYDPIYQLTQVLQGASQTESYTYDPVGNRLTSLLGQHSYNSSNQLTALTAAIYTYDNNGNMTGKTSGTNSTSYAWDNENRLSSVTLPNGGGVVSFQYDPFGRRIQKTTSSGATVYLYDGANIVTEMNGAGMVTASYTQGLGIDEPLAMRRGGYIGYYHADGLGSITSLTGTSGKTVATYVYDAFGNTTATEGIFNPYRYTGREQDPETGLYYYRARYYDPSIGRFISEDPIRLGGGINFYVYGANAPTQRIDPLGFSSKDVARLQQMFWDQINQWVQNGERHPGTGEANGWANDFNWHNYPWGKKYKSCNEQADALTNKFNATASNNATKFDDNWDFETVRTDGGFGFAVRAVDNSNTSDPVMLLDPWSGQILMNYPQNPWGEAVNNTMNGPE